MKRIYVMLLCSLLLFSGCTGMLDMAEIIIGGEDSKEDDDRRSKISDEEDAEWNKQNAIDDAAVDAEEEKERQDKLDSDNEALVEEKENKNESTSTTSASNTSTSVLDLFHYVTDDLTIPGLEAYGYTPYIPDGASEPLFIVTKESDYVEISWTYSKTRKSIPSKEDDTIYTSEVLLNVMMGFAAENFETLEEFPAGNAKYMEALDYKASTDISFANMSEKNKSVYLKADVSDSLVSCWGSYPWEELYPKGMVTGLYYSRDLGSYLSVELFQAEDAQYENVLNTVIYFYDEMILNRNWTLE